MRFQVQVLDLDPLAVSCRLNERPTTVKGKFLRPVEVMQQIVEELG